MLTLDESFWAWVESHMSENTDKLRLKYSSVKDGFDYDAAITQIECRQRFGKKLAQTLLDANHFYFPNKLSGEQSTSDRLADFHATLIKGQSMIDLTAGLGIDVFHCSGKCDKTWAIERLEPLCDALTYNAHQLGCDITVCHGDCREIITKENMRFDTAFIDPARRSSDGGRVFSLSDCEPDVKAMLPRLAQICNRLVIKMSPMLDISHTINALDGCQRIISLGNATECKELIALKDFGEYQYPTLIQAVTLIGEREVTFEYTAEDERKAEQPEYSMCAPGDYFYEPYPSVMKTGASKLLAQRFNLKAFHPNSRLYHSQGFVEDFPGNIFTIEKIIDFSSKYLKRFKNEYPRINVATRNFGMTAENLKNKLGVKDGGDKRLVGLCDKNNVRKLIVLSK